MKHLGVITPAELISLPTTNEPRQGYAIYRALKQPAGNHDDYRIIKMIYDSWHNLNTHTHTHTQAHTKSMKMIEWNKQTALHWRSHTKSLWTKRERTRSCSIRQWMIYIGILLNVKLWCQHCISIRKTEDFAQFYGMLPAHKSSSSVFDHLRPTERSEVVLMENGETELTSPSFCWRFRTFG